MKLLFITSNPAKIELAKERLSKYKIEVVQQPMELNECRSMEVEEVAMDKARQALNKLTENFLIEDSAFYIDSLNGFPGTFIKTAFDTLGEDRIVNLVKNEPNKKAIAKSVLAFGNPITKEIKLFTGTYEGEISLEPRGSNMRGWKVVRIFIPKGWNKTLAELDDNEWQKFLEEFRKNDHFDKLGKWLQRQS